MGIIPIAKHDAHVPSSDSFTGESNMYPSQKAERFQLRMPDGLRHRVKEIAEKNRRSMNAEIILMIERAAFDQPLTPENEKGAAPAS
jgi:hypothetical protein